MQSNAASVEEYLELLPPDRRASISTVRDVINAHLPDGCAERGMGLDLGKSCVRFEHIDEVPLDVLGEVVARIPVGEFIARYEATRRR